jgi:MoxR-like ATPase
MTEATTPTPLVAPPEAEAFFHEVGRVIVGQRELLETLLIALLVDGHVLIEGVPGLAKTQAVRTVSAVLALKPARVQFTPDLLPADLIGTQIYHPGSGEFRTKFGPIFGNILLADEINRAPAKVQSALLEAMQERQVTIGEQSYPLPKPFLVLATQNPIEQEGTYPLPEAQVDRFMFKVVIGYPTIDEELLILERMARAEPEFGVNTILTPDVLNQMRSDVDAIYLDEKLKRYVVDLVQATREPGRYGLILSAWLQHGASPRATIALVRAAKAKAFLVGRKFVTPDDVKNVAVRVLRHRIGLTYDATAQDQTAETLLAQILGGLPVP